VDRKAREPVATDCRETQRVEPSISREPLVEVIAEPMASVELVEQLEDDPRA
jgi:hypothetical protein